LPLSQDDAVMVVADDRANGQLRVEIEDELTRLADEAFGFAGLEQRDSSVPPQTGQKRNVEPC
jgi:hypothetical protein